MLCNCILHGTFIFCAGTVMDLILKSWICQQQRALYASLRVAVPSLPSPLYHGGVGGRVQLHVVLGILKSRCC